MLDSPRVIGGISRVQPNKWCAHQEAITQTVVTNGNSVQGGRTDQGKFSRLYNSLSGEWGQKVSMRTVGQQGKDHEGQNKDHAGQNEDGAKMAAGCVLTKLAQGY